MSLIVSALTSVEAILIVLFFSTILHLNYFKSRPKWRLVFLVGCVFILAALMHSLVVGSLELSPLKYVVFRIGYITLFIGVFGMHFKKWSAHLTKHPIFKWIV